MTPAKIIKVKCLKLVVNLYSLSPTIFSAIPQHVHTLMSFQSWQEPQICIQMLTLFIRIIQILPVLIVPPLPNYKTTDCRSSNRLSYICIDGLNNKEKQAVRILHMGCPQHDSSPLYLWPLSGCRSSSEKAGNPGTSREEWPACQWAETTADILLSQLLLTNHRKPYIYLLM